MTWPVPPGEAGLLVKALSKLNRPKALSPGGLAVSLMSRRRMSVPNFKLWTPRCHVTFAMYSAIFSCRISGLERELPRPAYPAGLMMGAEGWYGSLVSRPGMSFQTGFVRFVGVSTLAKRV